MRWLLAKSVARLWLAALCLLALPAALPAGDEQAAGFDQAVQPFFKTYCLRCHNNKQQKGEFRLDTLSRDFTDAKAAQHWEEVIFRMNAGEMPPKAEPKPTAAELSKVIDWLSTRLREGQATRMARRGPVAHYRLSRNEYQNTIYDLLGVYYDVNRPGVFNQDPLWHGFDHIGLPFAEAAEAEVPFES